MPVISASLFARFASRQKASPAMQAVAALRGQFGGHHVMTIAEGDALREGEVPLEPSKRDKVAHDVRSFEAKGDASSRAFERASQANVGAARDAVDAGAPPATEPTDQADTVLGTERSKRAD
jgi:6-phosphogluconate dehydrogenase